MNDLITKLEDQLIDSPSDYWAIGWNRGLKTAISEIKAELYRQEMKTEEIKASKIRTPRS